MAQPDKSKGRPDIRPGSKPICAAACPQPGFPAAPVPVIRYFATGDNDPSFITDIRVFRYGYAARERRLEGLVPDGTFSANRSLGILGWQRLGHRVSGLICSLDETD
jgi:hypothetical protein